MYSHITHCQTLYLDFSSYANQSVVITVPQATSADTLYSGILDDTGKATVQLSKKYQAYVGMATVQVGDKGARLDFIIHGENPVLRSREEYPGGNNIEFSNSLENTSLQNWFMSQLVRRQKLDLLTEVEKAYNPSDTFLVVLQREYNQLSVEQADFEKMLNQSPLYAAKFIKLYNFLTQEVNQLPIADSLHMSALRPYIRDSLDVESLYHSGLWFDILNGMLALYGEDTPFHSFFISDMSQILKRTPHDEIYIRLSENLFDICESMGWNNQEEELTRFLEEDSRIVAPTGKLKILFSLHKLRAGSKAPALSQGKLPVGKTLLVFYQSGCGPCEDEIQSLKINYPRLIEKGYQVVSVSSDEDDQLFKNTSASFPWADKYCDMKGLKGIDFENYGVIGTPTFYEIDSAGFIRGRYARLSEIGLLDD